MPTAQNDNVPSLISINETVRITSLSRTAISRLRAAKEFPAEVPLGDRRIAFVRQEVSDWIQARINARGQGRAFRSAA